MLWISHLDLAKTMTRVIRRAGIPVWYSEGFNPIPRLVFASSLSVGCAGDDEILDFRITEEMSDGEIVRRLRECVPPGIEINRAYTAEKKLTGIKWAENEIVFTGCDNLPASPETAIPELFSRPVVLMKRSKSGERETDISPLVKRISARAEGKTLTVTAVTGAGDSAYLNPEYVCRALEREFSLSGEDTTRRITRKGFFCEDGVTEFE